MKLIVCIMAAWLALTAQTPPPATSRGITADQLRASASTPVALLAVDGSGRFRLLRLGAGVRIVDDRLESSTVGRLRVQRAVRSAAGYTVPPRAVVVRNGLVQSEGVDYEIRDGVAAPLHPWQDDDIVVVVWLDTSSGADSAP